MEDDPKRILILTADVGFGHRSAANAIAAALKETRREACEVEILNLLDDESTPAFLRNTQSDYDDLVREMPEIYRLRYEISDTVVPNAIIENVFKVALFKVVREAVIRHRPDVILSTHTMYPAPVNAVLAVTKSETPFLTVVTDLVNVHRLWFNPDSDLCLVPTEEARQQGLALGLDENQLIITGIPVHPDLSRRISVPEDLRVDLGWRPDLPTFLVAGSKRIKDVLEYLHVINHSGLPLQLALVAGGDDELFSQFQDVEWHCPVHLYNYVDNMPTLMQAADCVISKAGGLIISEAFACGLPLLMVDVTPGQEVGNADYVVRNGAGAHAQNPLDALEIMFHWLDGGGKLLSDYKNRAQKAGRPGAAFKVADLAWSAALHGTEFSHRSRSALLPALLELLGSFGIVENGEPPPPGSKIEHA